MSTFLSISICMLLELCVFTIGLSNIEQTWAVVATQLVVWSLPISEIRSSNPVISNFKNYKLYPINRKKKTKTMKEEAGNGPIFKYIE